MKILTDQKKDSKRKESHRVVFLKKNIFYVSWKSDKSSVVFSEVLNERIFQSFDAHNDFRLWNEIFYFLRFSYDLPYFLIK